MDIRTIGRATVAVVLLGGVLATAVLLSTRPSASTRLPADSTASASDFSPSSAPAVTPRPLLTPRPSPAVSYSRWLSSSVETPHGGASIAGVVRFQNEYLAIGGSGAGRRPTMWTSTDGAAWSLTPKQPPAEPTDVWSVAANESRIVASVGFSDTSGSVLVSTNGRSWTTALSPPLWTIAALPDRFVGAARSADSFSIWTSETGLRWKKVAEGIDLGGGDLLRLRALTIGGRRIVVGVGLTRSAGDYGASLWMSADPTASVWRHVDLGQDGVGMSDVASNGDRLVAVGTAGYCCRVQVWTATDSLDWRYVGDPVRQGGMSPSSIVATPSGFLVAGFHAVGEERREFRAWTTADGEAWTAVPDDAVGLGQTRLDGITLTTRPDGPVIATATVWDGNTGTPIALVAKDEQP